MADNLSLPAQLNPARCQAYRAACYCILRDAGYPVGAAEDAARAYLLIAARAACRRGGASMTDVTRSACARLGIPGTRAALSLYLRGKGA